MMELTGFLAKNALPFLIAFAACAALGPVFIPWLHKLKFGQEIREEGPKWHQKKSGTPTMGGIMFITGIALAMIVELVMLAVTDSLNMSSIKGLIIFVIALGFGVIGFIDDYIKVVKKRNLGLTSAQKFIMQIALSVVYVLVMYFTDNLENTMLIPFTTIRFTMPVWLYIPFIIFVMAGVVNAVNLTDGLDGLASSITIVVGIFFMIASYMLLNSGAVSGFAAAMTGGLIGFLIYNKYPAKVFMGDTGSLFLGAAVALMAIDTATPIFLILVGFVYLCETLSVIIQVTSFKLTGKRVFKMSPIHHHFEMCGWSEKKIVGVFSAVTAVMCVISYFAIRL